MKGFEAIEGWILKNIHVGIPWKFLNHYREKIILKGMPIELGFWGEDLDALNGKDLFEVSKVFEDNGISLTIHAPFWDLCPGSIDPLIRKVSYLRLHQVMDVAEILKPKHIVCHTGFDPRHHREHLKDFIERAMPVWKSILKRAQSMGMVLVFENVWEETPYIHKDILERLSSPYCGFCLDVGHQNCFSKSSLSEWLEVLQEHLKEIHLHDNNGNEDSHSPVGKGTIDFHLLFKFLNTKELFPILTVEPHREDHFFETLTNLSNLIPGDLKDKYLSRLVKISKNT